MKPAAIEIQPPDMLLNTNTAPSIISQSETDPRIGQGIGCGT
jgi:hypothetical protein